MVNAQNIFVNLWMMYRDINTVLYYNFSPFVSSTESSTRIL